MKMVRVVHQPGEDITHDGVRYVASNSHRGLGLGEMDIPEHVWHAVSKTGAGITLAKTQPHEDPEHTCPACRHTFKGH